MSVVKAGDVVGVPSTGYHACIPLGGGVQAISAGRTETLPELFVVMEV